VQDLGAGVYCGKEAWDAQDCDTGMAGGGRGGGGGGGGGVGGGGGGGGGDRRAGGGDIWAGVTRLGSPASPRMVPVDAAACRAYRDPGTRNHS